MRSAHLVILCLFFFISGMGGCSTELAEKPVDYFVPTVQNTSIWSPSAMTSFQVQFNGEIDLNTDAAVIDLDAFETDQTVIEQLHQTGKKVICYINAGALEDWRPDANQFPVEAVGKAYQGWPGEHWLDIRALDALTPILEARLDLCRAKGFDGVEFDNVDGYQNKTGFDLTAADQLTFNRWLADAAHARGLAAGLKNDPEQMAALEPWFDFVILESCFEQGWCELAAPFAKAGKPVFDIEYRPIKEYCAQAEQLSITLIGKNRALDAEHQVCP